MTLHAISGGGHRTARRPFVLLAVALSLGLSQDAQAASAEDIAAQVSVREKSGVFTVTAQFRVEGSADTALAVLTDYERIPQFMPGVKTSVVRERAADRVVLEQDAVSKFMFFTRRVHLMLEGRQDRSTIRFRDLDGASFARYEGSWRVTDDNGHTLVAYDLTAVPSFSVPGALLSRLLKRDSAAMIMQLRREIGRSICRADGRS
jgi:carbon monoxide dehydrogenase subunit G